MKNLKDFTLLEKIGKIDRYILRRQKHETEHR